MCCSSLVAACLPFLATLIASSLENGGDGGRGGLRVSSEEGDVGACIILTAV